MKKNFYELLEVSNTTSQENIEIAYHALIKKLSDLEKNGIAEASNQIKFLEIAYEVLSRPEKRASYDSKLALSPIEPTKQEIPSEPHKEIIPTQFDILYPWHRKNNYCSIVVFISSLLFFSTKAAIEYFMGIQAWGDVSFIKIAEISVGLTVAFYFAYTLVGRVRFLTTYHFKPNQIYSPTLRYKKTVIGIALVLSSVGLVVSYLQIVKEQQLKAEAIVAEQRKQKEAAEAEKRRVAALTPEERAEEEAQRLEQEKIQREYVEFTQKFGNRPQKNGYDGSYNFVKYYLLEHMNNPDSLDMGSCSTAEPTSNGWETTCSYRGSNAYGAVVLNSDRFLIQNGVAILAR